LPDNLRLTPEAVKGIRSMAQGGVKQATPENAIAPATKLPGNGEMVILNPNQLGNAQLG